jgi:hypothetical protein
MTGTPSLRGERRHSATDRFRDLIQRRLLPGLSVLGFQDRLPGSLAVSEADGVLWLLDLPIAPWSTPSKICFTVAWGVHVPGLDEIVGDPAPATPTVDTCPISGRVGDCPERLDPRWFELRTLPRPAAGIAATSVANHVLGGIARDVLPKLSALSTPADVQRFLHMSLVTGRGNPSADELRTIRRIAALSLLLGDRENAARWLDHLEVRSAATMAPDLVAERLAPLRELIAS